MWLTHNFSLVFFFPPETRQHLTNLSNPFFLFSFDALFPSTFSLHLSSPLFLFLLSFTSFTLHPLPSLTPSTLCALFLSLSSSFCLNLSHTLPFSRSFSLSGRDVWGEAGLFASNGFLRWLGYTHCHTACQRMVCVSPGCCSQLTVWPDILCCVVQLWICVWQCFQWASVILYLNVLFLLPLLVKSVSELYLSSPQMCFFSHCTVCVIFVWSVVTLLPAAKVMYRTFPLNLHFQTCDSSHSRASR